MKNQWNNPLIQNQSPDADILSGEPPTIKKPKSAKREIRDLRRKQTATQAVAGMEMETEIFGFTKGQFSSIDLIEAVIDEIAAPAEYMAISTWAAAKTDVHQTLDMMHSGKVQSARWLIDYTFQRRMPGLAQEIRSCFGEESIRVAKNHAKFTLIQSGNWRIVIRTSMNLNYNPRFEDFTISHDPELFRFINGILDEVWHKQDKKLAFENAGKIESHFDEML